MYPPAHRTLDILELLADAPDGLALSAIAGALAMPKSVAHRLLAGLAERGFVQQDPDTQHYGLTLKLAALGFRHLAATRIEEVCQPVLNRLAADSGELARLAVVDGEKMTWVAKAQGALSGLRYDARRRPRRRAARDGRRQGVARVAPRRDGAGDRRAHRLRGVSARRTARRADARAALRQQLARHAQARATAKPSRKANPAWPRSPRRSARRTRPTLRSSRRSASPVRSRA